MGIAASPIQIARHLRRKSRRIWRKLAPSLAPTHWNPPNLSASSFPEANLRNYLERRDLRTFINEIPIELDTAAEIGCGFGRLTMTLPEFAKETVAYEREPELAKIATALLTNVRVENVASLDQLPVSDEYFSFVLTFTVLQHIADEHVERIIAEIKRIAKPKSYVLLVEETRDPFYAVLPDEPQVFTIGRPIAAYEKLMEPFKLIKTAERNVEPTYHSQMVGHYMLFARE